MAYIFGLDSDKGKQRGIYYIIVEYILRFYSDNLKQDGNYYTTINTCLYRYIYIYSKAEPRSLGCSSWLPQQSYSIPGDCSQTTLDYKGCCSGTYVKLRKWKMIIRKPYQLVYTHRMVTYLKFLNSHSVDNGSAKRMYAKGSNAELRLDRFMCATQDKEVLSSSCSLLGLG